MVHARNGKQKYREPADFSVYNDCVATGKTIVANGDISTVKQIEYLREIGVRGVMVGRAACRDASIFQDFRSYLDQTEVHKPKPTPQQLREELEKLVGSSKGESEYKTLCLRNISKRIGSDNHLLDHNLLI